MKMNDITDVMTIGFKAGLEAGIQVGQSRVFKALDEIHIHNEHGAMVYLDDLMDFLGEPIADTDETDLP